MRRCPGLPALVNESPAREILLSLTPERHISCMMLTASRCLQAHLGWCAWFQAIATRGLGSGKERVQPMHLSLDFSLFTKALEEGSKVYEAQRFFGGTA